MTDSTHRDSGITTSSEVLAHYAKTALMYEELRAAIDRKARQTSPFMGRKESADSEAVLWAVMV